VIHTSDDEHETPLPRMESCEVCHILIPYGVRRCSRHASIEAFLEEASEPKKPAVPVYMGQNVEGHLTRLRLQRLADERKDRLGT